MNLLKQFDIKLLGEHLKLLAGVDEVGRGPLAGPVIAAAVIFAKDTFIDGVNDSKKIKESDRSILAELIKSKALTYAYGIVNQNIIDEINILQATLKAMKIAVSKLNIKPDLIFIDGNKSFLTEIPTKTIVKGDSKSFSIAAASILAKVKRDELMKTKAKEFPHYAWEKNKGYGTLEHINAIKEFGITSLHRKTFLRKIISSETQGELL
ncbi:MAG: ribonuclease HII [Melioribacteraceae bacterium]|nr:ribonuclease HII [Melioribacteraceae bacterium]